MEDVIEVLLVNEQDEIIGQEEKLRAHELGLLHRAFSIFVFDPKQKRVLMQKRASGKYHSGGLYSNSCCSHPYANETMEESLARCMKDELNLCACHGFVELGSFHYYSQYETNAEHEIDHVFVYEMEECPIAYNPEEIESVAWMTLEQIHVLMNNHQVTSWFSQAFSLLEEKL